MNKVLIHISLILLIACSVDPPAKPSIAGKWQFESLHADTLVYMRIAEFNQISGFSLGSGGKATLYDQFTDCGTPPLPPFSFLPCKYRFENNKLTFSGNFLFSNEFSYKVVKVSKNKLELMYN